MKARAAGLHEISYALRRTYAALRAELSEHPAITAAQMGHRDPRMTLRVYTDVTGLRPRTRLSGLLGDADSAPLGTSGSETVSTGRVDLPAERRNPGFSRRSVPGWGGRFRSGLGGRGRVGGR
jgi:hypothetical protein